MSINRDPESVVQGQLDAYNARDIDAFMAFSREETLRNASAIAAATDLPVSADLEDGFGHRPEDAAETIRRAAAIGLVGGSIEDTTADPSRPIHDFGLAVERMAAAVEAARALPFPFTVTARAENFLFSRLDLDDTIARLRAFEAAGADVLYAPGLPDIMSIREVCASVSRPVNVVMGLIQDSLRPRWDGARRAWRERRHAGAGRGDWANRRPRLCVVLTARLRLNRLSRRRPGSGDHRRWLCR